MVLGTTQLSAIAVSEVVAFWLIWRLWRSGDHIFFKTSLSFIALIPFIGPLAVLWITHFPPPQHPAFRDIGGKRTDVYDRWRHIFEERNPVKRFYKWRELIGSQPSTRDSLVDTVATAAIIDDLQDEQDVGIQDSGADGGGD